MNAVGVIVEYNPFHNGHAYHVTSAKEQTGADIVIAVMSGNFLQRGEPALVSKWARTRMALMNGVDIVFELPYKFATQKAETFAEGAVTILNEAGCSSFCFGSESGDIQGFFKTAEFLHSNKMSFNNEIKNAVATGVSYPRAISMAYQALSPGEEQVDLSKPNNILGFQYIKAAQKLNTNMQAVTIQRKNANYHDIDFSSADIASATSIRKAIFSGDNNSSDIQQYLPLPTYKILQEYKQQFGIFHEWETYWQLLKYRLLQVSASELKGIYEMEEGLENRFISAAHKASSFKHFMELIKTKRYTWTRLQRACIHVLTNTTKIEMKKTDNSVSYLRLLGMTKQGQIYLNNRKKLLNVPLVSRIGAFKNDSISLDVKAAKIYALGLPLSSQQVLMEQEFKQHPIML